MRLPVSPLDWPECNRKTLFSYPQPALETGPHPSALSASNSLPRSGLILLETVFTECASVGARISLSEFNISLTIPGGALAPGQTQDIHISLVRNK